MTPDDDHHVVWARVDRDFYAANAGGAFLGCIDRAADGRFLALDAYTAQIGSFPDLQTAMTAVIGYAVRNEDE